MEMTLEIPTIEIAEENQEAVSESEIEKLREKIDLLWKCNEGNLTRYNYSDEEIQSIRKIVNKALSKYFFIVSKHNGEPENINEQKNFIYREPTKEQLEQWKKEREPKKDLKFWILDFRWLCKSKTLFLSVQLFKKRLDLFFS